MRMIIFIICFYTLPCFADSIKEVKSCTSEQGEEIQLLSLKTIDGDTLYLKFRNIITGAFIDNPSGSHDFVGDIAFSKCINNSFIFALEYGSPYTKGCLVNGWGNGDKGKNEPEGFCFAERDKPESIWFGKDNILVVIKNKENNGVKDTKYIIYDSNKPDGERSSHIDKLPSNTGYKIFNLK